MSVHWLGWQYKLAFYQGCLEAVHLVGFAVDENHLRRFQGPDEATRLLVVGVRREADVGHLNRKKVHQYLD